MFDGARAGRDDRRRRADRRGAAPSEPASPADTEAGRHDDLHVGHDGQAEGRAPPRRRRPAQVRGAARSSSATRPTTCTSRPARCTTRVPAGSWASRRRSARRSSCSASSTRRTGCASSTRTRSRRRSRAPTPIRMVCNLPDEVKAQYDRSSMRRDDRQRRAVELRARSSMYLARLPAGVAVRGLRLDRARREHASCEPEDQLRKPGSCGKAGAAGRDPAVRRRRQRGRPAPARSTPASCSSESPAVFADYYKQHDKFEADSRDGYQTVGDIAYRDDEGYLYICDRKKDMIISGGHEHLPGRDRGRARAAPRHLRGGGVRHPERGVGRVRARRRRRAPGRASSTEADVIAHAREHLASYKVPRSISWIDELPKTGSRQDPQARAARRRTGPAERHRSADPVVRDQGGRELAARGVDLGAPVLRGRWRCTPRSREAVAERRSRRPAGCHGVGQPGVGLSGMRFTWASSGTGERRQLARRRCGGR